MIVYSMWWVKNRGNRRIFPTFFDKIKRVVFSVNFEKNRDYPIFIPSYDNMVRRNDMNFIYGKGSENPSGYEYPLYI